MAKTQAQWFQTLKSWVPEWFFQTDEYAEAHFQAMAKVLSVMEEDLEETAAQTFISEARENFLGLHGDERSVKRIPGEFDSQYATRIRIKSMLSRANKPDLVTLINQLLIKGKAAIKEDWEGSVFFNRSSFFNRGEVIIEPIENTFTVVVDKQVHDPYSFFNRECFMGRGDFMGTTESSDYVFQLILNAVNDNKALGVFYRIFERTA